MADKLTPQDIDYILGRSNPEPVKRPSKSQPFQDLKKLSPIVPSGLAGLAGVAADLGASFAQGAKRLPAMWDQQTAYNDYKIAEKYGLDPSEALAGLLAAKMRMDQIPSVDGTEKVNQLFTDEGDGFMQELPGALANTPNFIAEQLPTSILGHPRQFAGQIGGGLAGAAIGMPIAGSAIGGTALGGPEYGAEIMGDALERGQYPGAEKIGMDGIDPVKQAIASYGSSALDSAGEGLELLGKTGADNLIADLLIRAGRGAAIEAPTEAAQQALQIFGSGGDVTTKESIDEIKQAAGAGGIMGGGLGALGTVTGERKKKEEGKDTPDDPRAWVAAPEPKIPPSTGPAGLPGYIDADALREKVEPKAPPKTPEAAPEVSPTEGIETSGVEAPEERIGDDIKDDIAYAQRFADAATDEPDIITPDALGQAPEGVTRSFERVPVFERQRLSLEDAQRTVETEIAARRDQGMSFREALDDYLESPIKKQLDELVNPSWHQTPMADDDAPVGFGVRVIDTLPDGTQQSVVVSPKGKPLDEKSYEEFVKGLQPPPIEAPKPAKLEPIVAKDRSAEVAELNKKIDFGVKALKKLREEDGPSVYDNINGVDLQDQIDNLMTTLEQLGPDDIGEYQYRTAQREMQLLTKLQPLIQEKESLELESQIAAYEREPQPKKPKPEAPVPNDAGRSGFPLLKAEGWKSSDSLKKDLKKFLDSGRGNAWIETNGYNLYVRRKGTDGNFEVANINRLDENAEYKNLPADQRKKRGSFKELTQGIEEFAQENGYPGVTWENVQNHFLPEVFERYGYESDGNTDVRDPTYRKQFNTKPDNNNRDLRSQFSPAEKEWLADELRKMLDGMKFPNVGIAILDSLGDAMGQYNFSTETIELAMDTMSGDTPAATLKAARGLLNHEIVHAFLAMNIIDEASWARIKDEIKNKPITAAQIKKLGYGADVVPGMTWLEAVLAEYPDYSSEYYFGYAEELAAETGMSFEEALETAQIEEAVAEFSRLQGINNDAVPAFIRPLVSGLADAWRRVLNAVRNFFNKAGPKRTSELKEFVRALHSGELGPGGEREIAGEMDYEYDPETDDFKPKMALGDGKLRGRLEVDDTEYFGPKKSEIDPAGFFSALQNAWEAAKNRPNVPDRLPVYKWIQRLQAARIPDRPKMEEIRWFFRDVPFDATLSKASIDKIMSENRLSLNVIDSSYNPITDAGFDPDEKIRTTNVRLPAAEGADQTSFERVLQLPKGVPGSDYQYSHQNRAPIFVEGSYVSALGETRPVQMRDGTVIENADFAHQVQADIVQKQQTETLPGLDQEIAQLEASEKSYRESGLPMPPAFQKKLLDARATRRLIKNPPPLNSTEQFTKIGVWTAMFQAATNGRDAIAFPFGETADRIQGGGGDNHSKVGGRAKFYTTQVRNTVYRIANRLGATVELGYVTYTAKDQKQAATPELKSIANSLNPESPALQNLANQMKQLVAMPEMTRGDLTMLLANYSMTAGMLGQESPEIDSILSNIDRLIAPAQSNQRRAPVYIMRLNPQMRAKILRSGMPLFAAKGSRYNPKGKHVPKTVSNPVGSDYIPVIPGTLQDLDEITSQMSYKQVAPKMLRKPFVGGIVDYLDKSLQFALKGMWKKTGPLASLYQYWGPMGNMKDQDIFVGLLMKAQGRVAQSAEITKLAQTLSSNEAEHENVMDYMMTKSGVVSYSRQNPDGSWTQYVDNSEALALQRIKDPKVREAAKSAKQVMIDLGHLLVQHNLISEKQRKSHEGTYLPRMFMKYLNSYIVPTGPRMSGVGYNYGRKGKMVRQQGDPTEQGLMDPNNPNPQAGVEWTQVGPTAEDDIIAGQIKDPGILVAHAVQVGVRDVAVQNFLAAILEHGAKTNNGWVLPNTTVKYDGKIMNLWTLSQEKELIDQMLIEKMAQDARLGVTSYDSFILQQESSFIDALLNRTPEWNKVYQAGELPNGYKMIPKNKWVYDGAAGAIVKDEIFHYLKSTANGLGLEDGTAAAEVARVGGKALNVFKMAKTVFSPASQMRQHVSNALALPLYGINMVRWGQALGAIVEHYSGKPNKYVKVAIENGQTTQSFTQAELRQVGELHRKLMSKRGENSAIRKVPVIGDLYHIYHSTNEWISWIKKTADTVNEVGARASNAAGTFYQLADSIAKVAVIIDEMDRGIPPILAAEKAREYFGDYSHVRPWVRFLRSAPGIAPFITYSYIMLPNMIKAFATAPWRFAPIYAFYVFMAAMATAELGGDDEDQEKAMKEALNILDDDTKIKEVTKLERILDDPEVNQLAKDRAQKRLDKIREDSSLLTAYRMTQPDYVRDDPYLFMNLLAPRDKYGRLQMTTLKPIIPFGQFADTWPGLRDGRMLDALGSIGVNGGPLFSNASVWATGIEPGLEREIWNKYDPQEVKNAKSLAYTLSSITSPEMSRFSPPGAVTPGLSLIPGYAAVEPGQGWSTFAGNGVNKYGSPNLTPEQLAIREMGFNIMPGDVNLGHEIRLKGYDRKIQEAKTDINTIYKDQTLINEDGELSKIGQDRVKLYEEQLKNLIKERSDYINRVSEILALEAENEFAKPEE